MLSKPIKDVTDEPIPGPLPDKTHPIIAKFHTNLGLMRDWYRSQHNSGRELGHNVMAEIIITDVLSALSLAIQGKTWSPPK